MSTGCDCPPDPNGFDCVHVTNLHPTERILDNLEIRVA